MTFPPRPYGQWHARRSRRRCRRSKRKMPRGEAVVGDVASRSRWITSPACSRPTGWHACSLHCWYLDCRRAPAIKGPGRARGWGRGGAGDRDLFGPLLQLPGEGEEIAALKSSLKTTALVVSFLMFTARASAATTARRRRRQGWPGACYRQAWSGLPTIGQVRRLTSQFSPMGNESVPGEMRSARRA